MHIKAKIPKQRTAYRQKQHCQIFISLQQGKYHKGRNRNDGGSGTQAIQTIRQIDGIGFTGEHKEDQYKIQNSQLQ